MERRLTLPKPKTYAQYGIVILIIKVFLSYATIGKFLPYLDNFLSILAVLFLGMSILNKGYKIKTLFIYGIISLLGLYSSYYTDNLMLFISILTIIAIDLNNLTLLFIYKYESFAFIFLSFLSIIAGYSRMYDEEGISLYFDFGFSHPNVVAAMLFNFMILWIWLSYDDLKRSTYVKLIIFSFLVYFMTGSRTILIVGLFTICLVSVSKSGKKWICEGMSFAAGYIVPVLTLFFLYTTINYQSGGPILKLIDTLMTGRLKLGAYAYEHYGLTLLGQAVGKGTQFGYDALWNMSKFTTFDNLYTKLMINNGYIWLILISISFWSLSKHKNNILNCMLIVWAIYGITEGHGLNVYLCFPIFFLSLLIGENRKTKQ